MIPENEGGAVLTGAHLLIAEAAGFDRTELKAHGDLLQGLPPKILAAPILRQYQIEVLGKVRDAIRSGKRRILLVAPTGAGKTVLAAEIIRWFRHEGMLFVAHRRELIHQASAKLHAVGIDHGIIQADHPTRPEMQVQVASIATLHARAVRTRKMEMPPAKLLVIDEAHHSAARTYQRIAKAYPDSIIVGLTATPCRGDGRGLGSLFEMLIECPQVGELTAAGFLVPAIVYAPTRPDLKGVRIERGDYNEAQLAQRMDRPDLIGDVVTEWLKRCRGRPTVVFACGVAHSVHLRDSFRAGGIWAEHIDGSTPAEQRDSILARLAQGTVEVVTNCAVLTEGWDAPVASCAVLAQPTKSLGRYRQAVGRVLRPAPGKTDAIILDHAGAVFEHGLPSEPIIWTLSEDSRAENPMQAARSAHKAPKLTDCPECKAVRLEGKPCTTCGWHPVAKPQHVRFADGELGRVDHAGRVSATQATQADKFRFYRMLLWYVADRGYAPGWAGYKYKEKFATWPERSWRSARPEIPDDATRAWVRSRQIAFAKRRDAA